MGFTKEETNNYIKEIMDNTPDTPYFVDKRNLKTAMKATEFRVSVQDAKGYLLILAVERTRYIHNLQTAKGELRREYLDKLGFVDGEIRVLEYLLLEPGTVRL